MQYCKPCVAAEVGCKIWMVWSHVYNSLLFLLQLYSLIYLNRLFGYFQPNTGLETKLEIIGW